MVKSLIKSSRSLTNWLYGKYNLLEEKEFLSGLELKILHSLWINQPKNKKKTSQKPLEFEDFLFY